jgi:hypothetical protein
MKIQFSDTYKSKENNHALHISNNIQEALKDLLASLPKETLVLVSVA